MSARLALPADQGVRDLLVSSFDRNYIVEASAGSGKTTILIERLVQLLAGGHAQIQEVAALTFTRKAAAEMRSRFQIHLEKQCHESTDPHETKRLRQALDHVHQTYIGTIHGFCSRLLREFATEAGLPAGFEEVQPEQEDEFRVEVWAGFVNTLYERRDPVIKKLKALGIELRDLYDSFTRFCNYSDVDGWPAEVTDRPDLAGLREKLADYHQHMHGLAPKLPIEVPDRLMQAFRRLPRLANLTRWNEPMHVLRHLEEYDLFDTRDLRVRSWPDGQKQGYRELERWNAFCAQVTLPLLHAWRAHRYPVIMKFLTRAAAHYQEQRLARGQLTYQDLLDQAVKLVQENAGVRRQIAEQWKRLLVDEFQDTDPLQAELLFLLTSKRQVTQWLDAEPRAGSLFLVGDPKQSIYRFRRADIVVYEQVKARVVAARGEVVRLTANFRAQPALVDWVNKAFTAIYSVEATPYQTPYTSMDQGRTSDTPLSQSLRYIEIPEQATGRGSNAIASSEAEWIARFIHEGIRGELKFERTEAEQARGLPATAMADDFMILTSNRNQLHVYGESLSRWRIRHQVSGGSQLNTFAGLRLMHLLLHAATHPEDDVAFVGLLRSELCGLSDAELFDYHQAGGRFDWRVNEIPSCSGSVSIRQLGHHLRRLASDLGRMTIGAALERTLAELGLLLWAYDKGDTGPGSLGKALICVREFEMRTGSVEGVLHGLERLMARQPRRDGLYLPSQEGVGVRIMNIHKAKGLEARVVILADCAGDYRHQRTDVNLHVHRTDEGTTGALLITRPYGPYSHEILAHPDNWPQCESEESKFLEAERKRRVYVAATRARDLLVVCFRSGTSASVAQSNPWRDLVSHLGGASRVTVNHEETPEQLFPLQAATESPLQSAQTVEDAWLTSLTPTASPMTTPDTELSESLCTWAETWQSRG
jgi:ATP-dependent helicase/nuclease subunit A